MVTPIKIIGAAGAKGANGTATKSPTAGGNGVDAAPYLISTKVITDLQKIVSNGGDGGKGGNGKNSNGAAGGNGGASTIAFNTNIFAPTLKTFSLEGDANGGNGGLGGTGDVGFSNGAAGNGGSASVDLSGNVISSSQNMTTMSVIAAAVGGSGAHYGNAAASASNNIITVPKATSLLLQALASAAGPDDASHDGDLNYGVKTAHVDGNIVTGAIATVTLQADALASNASASISNNIFDTHGVTSGSVSIEATGQHIQMNNNKFTLGTQDVTVSFNTLGPSYGFSFAGNNFIGNGGNSLTFQETSTPGPNSAAPYIAAFDMSSSVASGQANMLGNFKNLTLTADMQGTVIGNALDNTITGGNYNDVLGGGAGSDTLIGNDGDDILDGGAGNDTLNGGAGSDTASYADASGGVTVNLADANPHVPGGGAGSDTFLSIENLTGSAYGDTLTGDGGNNVLTGGAGDDVLDGASGTDTASYADSGVGVTVSLAAAGAQNTGDGSDTLVHIENLAGSNFNDSLTGDAGANLLSGGAGNDTLEGGLGDDILDGGAGSDTVSFAGAASGVVVQLNESGPQDTLAGIDTLISIENATGSNFDDQIFGNSGDNILDGGAGDDQVSYFFGANGVLAANGVTVDLSISGPQNTGAGIDTLISFKSLVGTNHDDILTASDTGSLLYGFDGNDILVSGAGNDRLDGSSGSDTASYAKATMGVTVQATHQSLTQDTIGAGIDTLSSIANLIGSAFDDTLTGSADGNVIHGGAGNDTIAGAGGSDLLYGEAGNDTLAGGTSNDTLDGGAGNDTADYSANGAAVSVTLSAAGAQDTVGAGMDTLVSIENLTGSAFNDTLTGDGGDNILTGGLGDDTLTGGAGNDTASYAGGAAVSVNLALAGPQNTGGAGSDTLVSIENLTGSAVNDMLTGDGGDNILTGGLGDDVLTGGAGNDTASYAGGAAVSVSLALAGAQNTGGAGSDTLVGMENLTGSNFDDHLSGDVSNNVLHGGAGNDTITSGGGNDSLYGDANDDTLAGGAGNDRLDGGAGSDTVDYSAASAAVSVNLSLAGAQAVGGGQGSDTLVGIENLIGSAFNDSLTGDSGNNVLEGGLGDDALNGGAGRDTASYAHAGSGVNVSLAAAGAQNTGSAGTDMLTAMENLTGSAFDDTLAGNAGDNALDGGAGLDTVTYAAASAGVTVSLAVAGPQNTGAAGMDTLSNFEALTGSGYNDQLSGDAGDNILTGGTGDDALDGGAGTDTANYSDAAVGVTVSLATAVAQNTGDGNDTLVHIENLAGSIFNDHLTGDAGDNVLTGGAGDDALDGAGGSDTASYADSGMGVTVSLAAAGAQDTGDGIDTLVSIENLAGSKFNDTLTGDAGDNVLSGGAGDDTLVGGLGYNHLDGGAGIDTVSFAHSAYSAVATLQVGWADSHGFNGLDFEDGYSILVSIENLIGSDYNDQLAGDSADNILDGGGGMDEVIYAGASSGVTVDLRNSGPQTIGADQGVDTLISIEWAKGSLYDDTLFANDSGSTLEGNAGKNMLFSGAGNDTMYGFGGNDDTVNYAYAGSGVTASLATGQAYGGGGVDALDDIENLIGSAYNDILAGTAGNNVLDGGGGIDTAYFSGDERQYTIGTVAGVTTVTGPDGTDTLTGIERLKFLGPDHVSDISNDGWGDLIYQNGTNGKIDFIASDGSNPGGEALVALAGAGPGAAFKAIAMGEFKVDTDRTAQLLLQDQTTTGGLEILSFTGGTASSIKALTGAVPLTLHAIDTGDFNGDGASDILLQNTSVSGGAASLYLLDGTSATSGNIASTGTTIASQGAGWTVIGSGDFNGDGTSDILWQNTGTAAHNIRVDLISGGAVQDGLTLLGPGSAYTAIGTGDFNGDGKSDILFQDSGTGNALIWRMIGTARTGSAITITKPAGAGWTVMGAEDYNKDGVSDILWQKGGNTDVQLMNANLTPAGLPFAITNAPGAAFTLIGSTGGG